MKAINVKSILLILVFIQIFALGCKKLNIEKELRIDIGKGFQNDFVTIKLDNNVVFSDTVSTNQMLGVSKILKFDYPTGKYEISVSINGDVKEDKFRHTNNRFVYISYNKSSSLIEITYPEEMYIYD